MQMAAFPYQDHVFYALDFASFPTVFPFDLLAPSAQQQSGNLAGDPSCSPCYYPLPDAFNDFIPADTSTVNAGISSISSITTATPTPESSSSPESGRTVPSENNKMNFSSSSVQRSEDGPGTQCFLPKKNRKERQRCRSESAQSKGSETGKGKKLKKLSVAVEKAEKKKVAQEKPTGYIHVRARRGEATDSHSLAERVRRKKIREKMKMLQDLVPGCDKVVGKALLLEEIINYVQSLKSQVEFLSMKLASLDPMFYDVGLDCDDYKISPERLENMSLALPSAQRASHIQPTGFSDATNSYPVQDSSVTFLLQGQDLGSFHRDTGSDFVMQVGDQRQSFLNQVEFLNMSFQ